MFSTKFQHWIWTNFGMLNIKELYDSKFNIYNKICFDKNKNHCKEKIQIKNRKPCLIIQTNTGNRICCSENLLIKVDNKEYICAKDLKKGHKVCNYCNDFYSNDVKSKINNNLQSWMLGLIHGLKNLDIVEDKYYNTLFKPGNDKIKRIIFNDALKHQIVAKINNIKKYKNIINSQFVPKYIRYASKPDIFSFINGYNTMANMNIVSNDVDEDYIESLFYLLKFVGIMCHKTYSIAKGRHQIIFMNKINNYNVIDNIEYVNTETISFPYNVNDMVVNSFVVKKL